MSSKTTASRFFKRSIRNRFSRTPVAWPLLLPAFLAILLVGSAAPGIASGEAAESPAAITVYDDAIGPLFQNWSWAATDLTNRAEVDEGATSIRVDYGSWQGLYFGTPAPVAIGADAVLSFSVMTAPGSQNLELKVFDRGYQAGPGFTVGSTDGQWQRFDVPLSELGGMTEISGLWWQNQSADPVVAYFDNIVIGQTVTEATGPTLTVDLGARTISRTITDPGSGEVSEQALAFPHAISDGIYGMNFAEPSLRAELGIGTNRWGGNGTERFNHTNGNSNKGNDYFFMADPGPVGGEDDFERANRSDGASTLLTVPLMGWVASDNEATCSYPASDIFGSQHNASPMDASATHWVNSNLVCGNGMRNGAELDAVDPTLTSVSVDPTFAREWVTDLVADHGSADEGGIEAYALGNEPGLWHHTHRDIRANPIDRAELIERSLVYGRAVKDGDASADVYGPVSWGGYSYFVTPAEFDAGLRPGQVPTLLGSYLEAMADEEQQSGRRVLDGLAVNFYDDRVFWGGSDGLRVRSPRSLWDPSYAPSDWWPVRDFIGGEGYALLPRLNSLIDGNYPDTKLAITEYNFGGLDTMAGGIAQADALGIFGREGVDIATLWDPYNVVLSPPVEQFVNRPAMFAYRMYRNYDGEGGRFGNEALFAESSDPDQMSVYAARRSDGALTIMVVNLSTSTLSSELSFVGGEAAGTDAELYRYDDSDATRIRSLGSAALSSEAARTFPGRSITLMVVPDGGVEPPVVDPPVVDPPVVDPPPVDPPVVDPPVVDPPVVDPPTTCHRAGAIVGALPVQPPFAACTMVNQGEGTSTSGPNSWSDDFDHGLSFADMSGTDYQVFDVNLEESVTWRHADHWMVDIAPRPLGSSPGKVTGGSFLRPDRTFAFEDGKLVIETDVAAGIDAYNPFVWPEIVVTTGAQPGERRPDGLYGYDHFRGHNTLGCRLQADHNITCSLMNDTDFGIDGGRDWEISFFQHEGEHVFGGADFVDQREWFRHCGDADPDVGCRDRFRLELEANRLAVYVNGNLYFEQSDRLNGGQFLPDEFVNSDLYVYATSMVGSDDGMIRFHWDRLAVNPSSGPSPSPTYD